jgi:hypothetical protein
MAGPHPTPPAVWKTAVRKKRAPTTFVPPPSLAAPGGAGCGAEDERCACHDTPSHETALRDGRILEHMVARQRVLHNKAVIPT